MSYLPLSLDAWLDHEDGWLAPYAMRSRATRGRRHSEVPHPYRTPYQRDRERIVHSSAFRRMTGKTQVLVATINDHHRTRLTHTLEVAQVARTVARRLRLNDDLTEAIALAHDIGHPPFGHAGEQALNECLVNCGGFNHNLFGLRRVDLLEERYPEFPGLNLTFEVREAFVHHSKNNSAPEATEFQNAGSPLLEAQVVDAVDSIVYDTHDIDDALGLGLISFEDLQEVDFWKQAASAVEKIHPGLEGKPYRVAVVRELLSWQVTDLLDETARRIQACDIRNLSDVRAARVPLVALSPRVERMKTLLESFLKERVYRHPRVLRMTANGKRLLKALFLEYIASPELLPEQHLRRWTQSHNLLKPLTVPEMPGRLRIPELERVVGDYLAGMTDRFAHQEYRRLFSPTTEL